MSTQPVLDLPPSIPPPQTVVSLLNQIGSEVVVPGISPGEQPVMELHMARSIVMGNFQISTADAPGDLKFNFETPQFPELGSTATQRMAPTTPQMLYFVHSCLWNAQVEYNFWAVKPPMAVGRARVSFRPPNSYGEATDFDSAQRDIMKEWDLSASNIFDFSVFGYNMRNFRSCMATTRPNSAVVDRVQIPLNDYKMGYLNFYMTNRYQPGSIFPETCHVYIFQSFVMPQFKIYQGPFLAHEESALTSLTYSDLNPTA